MKNFFIVLFSMLYIIAHADTLLTGAQVGQGGAAALGNVTINQGGLTNTGGNYFQSNRNNGAWVLFGTNGHFYFVDNLGTIFKFYTNGLLSLVQTNGSSSVFSNGSLTISGAFTGSGSGLTSLTAANIASGTAGIDISGHALTSDFANEANQANGLNIENSYTGVSFTGAHIGDGSGLTGIPTTNGFVQVADVGAQVAGSNYLSASSNLPAAKLTGSGTLPTGVLPASVSLLGQTIDLASEVTGTLPATSLGGTIADARLSANVLLTNAGTSTVQFGHIGIGIASDAQIGMMLTAGQRNTNTATGLWMNYTNGVSTWGPTNAAATVTANGSSGVVTATSFAGSGSGLTAASVPDSALQADVSLLGQTIIEGEQVLSDVTTLDVSTAKHGYAPKGDGTTTKFLNANGVYSTPAGGGTQIYSNQTANIFGQLGDFSTNAVFGVASNLLFGSGTVFTRGSSNQIEGWGTNVVVPSFTVANTNASWVKVGGAKMIEGFNAAGVSKFSIDPSGTTTINGATTISGNGLTASFFTVAGGLTVQGNGFTTGNGGGGYIVSGKSAFYSPSDGSTVFVNNASNTISSVQFGLANVSKTANYTLVALDVGKWFNNIGSGGPQTNTFPAAVAGYQFAFIVSTNAIFALAVNSGDVIYDGNLSATAPWSNQTNSCMLIESTKAGVWQVLYKSGLWNGFSAINLDTPTAITFPATTVNWTNTIGYRIELVIDENGVTGSAIKKNGTTICTTPSGMSTLSLRPGEYFSETYTIGSPTATYVPSP